MKTSTQLLARTTVRQLIPLMAMIAVLLVSSSAYAAESDYVKPRILAFLQAFQGQLGDWIVIGSLVCALVAFLRKSVRTGVGFMIIVSGVVVLRITISILFG